MDTVRKKPKEQQHKILRALDLIESQDLNEPMGQDQAAAWIAMSNHPFFKDLLDRMAHLEHVADRFNNHAHLNNGDVVVKL